MQVSNMRNGFFYFFFFFQAEDGIRDLTVTGVQTCALPISERGSRRSSGRVRPSIGGPSAASRGSCGLLPEVRLGTGVRAESTGAQGPNRSEERRVGKEGRSRGAAGQ